MGDAMIRKAKYSDLDVLDQLSLKTIEAMNALGIKQWNQSYPRKSHFKQDIDNDSLYVFDDHNTLKGVMALMEESEEAYKIIRWQKDNSMVVHRIMVFPMYQKQGIARQLLTFAIDMSHSLNKASLKIDTLPENYKMQRLLKSMAFQPQGYLSNINRDAFEIVLESNEK